MIHRDEYLSQATNAASTLGDMGAFPADVVIQCGSGMAGLGDIVLPGAATVELDAVPHFPRARVPGHTPIGFYSKVNGLRVLVLAGRVHVYEGHTPLTAGFPAAVAHALGAKLLVLLNSAGALNQHFAKGSVMVHTGFINFQGENALGHLLSDTPAELFVDPNPTYNQRFSQQLAQQLAGTGLSVSSGTYIAVRGPVYETQAELMMMRSFGADAIGMSTVPEATVAHWLGIPLCGVSIVTNECFGGDGTGHSDVVAASHAVLPVLAESLRGFLLNLTL